MDTQSFRKLVSNYYTGELVTLSFKLFSAVFIVIAVFILLYFHPSSIVQYFSYDIFVIYGIIIAKTIYQGVQYFLRRKEILTSDKYNNVSETSYILKREALLSKHRRLHVYSVLLVSIAFIIIIFYPQYDQVFALLLALFIVSTMLLSFSLFNSFRLSEYKNLMSK